jgi:hypothetical protein
MLSPQVKVSDVDRCVPKSCFQLEWYSSSPRAWLLVNLQVGWLVEEVRIKPSSHASDGVVEATWPWCGVTAESCRQWCCQGDITRGVMLLTSHAGDGTTEVTWLWRDVDTEYADDSAAESCW